MHARLRAARCWFHGCGAVRIPIPGPSGGRTFCRKAPTAEISAEKPKKRRPREKTPKRNKHFNMLKPASTKFRQFPAEFRRFPAEFRRFPASCFAQNLILKKNATRETKNAANSKKAPFSKKAETSTDLGGPGIKDAIQNDLKELNIDLEGLLPDSLQLLNSPRKGH